MALMEFIGNPAVVQTLSYGFLFFLMIIEGPIITTVAAFLSSLNFFNPYAILLISGFGNIAGDIIWYSVGRSTRKTIIEKRLEKSIIKKEKVTRLEELIQKNPFKALFIIKFIPPLPLPGLMLSGAMRMKIKDFLTGSIILSFLYSGIFTAGGYFLGVGFANNFIETTKYLGYLIIFIGIIILIVKEFNKRSNQNISQGFPLF